MSDLYTENKKEFWKYIGKLSIGNERKQATDVLVTSNGSEIRKPTDIMKEWSRHFSELLNVNAEDSHETRKLPMPNIPPINEHHNALHQIVLNRTISINEIHFALEKAKIGKAVGNDVIPMEILKNNTMSQVMLDLFNTCFSTGRIPSKWRESLITPVPKSGDRRFTKNYRGISITCAMYKIYCQVISSRLNTWAEEMGFLGDEQNGFRKSRSCMDHLSSLTMIIETRKIQKRSTFCAFVDFRKAYDAISRDLLWHKLQCYGLTGKIMTALQDIYASVISAVKVNGQVGDWFEVGSGVKQGCLNSSFLFNMYLNDLIYDINDLNLGVRVGDKKISLLCYADDIVLVAEKEKDLQVMLDRLDSWCSVWKMSINADKTKVMHCRPRCVPVTKFRFKCGNKDIDTTSSYKYLGLTLDQFLDYKVTAKAVAKAAHRALGVLIAKDKASGGMPYQVFTSLYDTLVQPIISYGASVWGQQTHSCVSTVQFRAMKYFMGLPKCAPNSAVIGDMGWLNPDDRHWLSVGRNWCRLVNMKEHRLNKHVFQWGQRASIAGTKNWISRCRSKWQSLDVNYDTKKHLHTRNFISSIKMSLINDFHESWHNDINRDGSKVGNGNNKLRLYKLLKSEISPECYLYRLNRKHRSALARFRCGIPLINIEFGRYRNIPIQDRKCSVCTECVEDELHVLLHCPCYSDIRKELLDSISDFISDFESLNDYSKLGVILASDNTYKFSAKACFKIMEKRKQMNCDKL